MPEAQIKVTYVDHMGSDLSVCNSARVSFDKKTDWVTSLNGKPCHPCLSEGDIKLIKFLARGMSTKDYDSLVDTIAATDDKDIIKKLINDYRHTPTHTAPFGHCFASFRVTAPVFVARQLVKHEYMRMSEISRRYVQGEPELYYPDVWRKKADNVKQGSSDEAIKLNKGATSAYVGHMYTLLEHYDNLLCHQTAPEMARMVLPQSMMTSWVWSGSLDAFANMCNLRLDPHAQEETRIVAQQISDKMGELFPVSWKALLNDEET